jgi:hypothetical protein
MKRSNTTKSRAASRTKLGHKIRWWVASGGIDSVRPDAYGDCDQDKAEQRVTTSRETGWTLGRQKSKCPF